MPIITISQENLEEIMTEVGFPILEFDDDFPYTESQVKQSAIWPAMKEFYRYWPIENIQDYSVSGNFSFDFPNEETFFITDARLNSNVPTSSTTVQDPFVNSMNISISQSSGMYGTRYNYDITTAYHMRRAEMSANKNANKAFRIDVDEDKRKVKGYSTVTGRITVVWAEYGLSYDSISFRKIDDVKKLAQSNLLRMMGNFFLMQSSDTQNEMDGSFMIDRADELREEIIEKWNNITKPVIIRG